MHHYLRPIPLDFSLRPYHSHTYHFSTKTFFLVDLAPFQHPYFSFTPLDSTHRLDFSALPITHFMCGPTRPFSCSLVIMAHTRSQYLEALFTTLHSIFIETQQEVRHLSANISTINKKTCIPPLPPQSRNSNKTSNKKLLPSLNMPL